MTLKHVLRHSIIASAILCLAPLGALAQDSAKVAAADKQFMMKAAQGGQAEVEMGQIATQNAQSEDVKKFGQRMVDDHTKAGEQLKQLASQKGVSLPSGLSAKDQAEKDKMSKMKGADFDKMYIQHMVQDHKTDIAEFQKEANSGKDSDVKNWASQTLPTLQDHLKNAQQVDGEVMKSSNSKPTTTEASKR